MNVVTPSVFPQGLDRAGMVLSSACAVHCALMPSIAGLLPLVGLQVVASEATESLILGATLLLAVASLAGGCRHHRRMTPLLMVAAGFGSIACGRLLLEDLRWAEASTVVAGALLIGGAHMINWRLCCQRAPDPCTIGMQRAR